ncbi:unnamed protein product, partial [marine sediment metagenome]
FSNAGLLLKYGNKELQCEYWEWYQARAVDGQRYSR